MKASSILGFATYPYVCTGGGRGGKFPLDHDPSPPQRFSTSLTRDVTQKKIFSLPYSPPLKKFFLPALFPPLQNFFAPCPIPLPENLISPWPFPPSPEIIWPIPYPHHPPLPYPHPLSQKSKFISPSYIFYFPAHIPLLNFLCSSPCISPSIEF